TGDAIKALEPGLESGMPAVDVIEVNRAAGLDAGTQIDRLMRDTGTRGEGPVSRCRITDQQHVRRQHGQQAIRELRSADGPAAGVEIQCPPAPVARNEQALVFAADAAPRGDAAAPPWRARQVTRALL